MRTPRSALPGRTLHSMHPVLTPSPSEDDFILLRFPSKSSQLQNTPRLPPTPHPVLLFPLPLPGPPLTWTLPRCPSDPHSTARQLPCHPEENGVLTSSHLSFAHRSPRHPETPSLTLSPPGTRRPLHPMTLGRVVFIALHTMTVSLLAGLFIYCL